MRIRMLVGISGPALTLEPGDRHDFPQDEALRLIAAGIAAPVAEIEIERAVLAPVVEQRKLALESSSSTDCIQQKKKRR